MRVFIAIELENNLKDYIFQNQQIVKTNSIKGNFSRKENFHLTLRFIGEANSKEIEDLKDTIDKTTGGFSRFELELGKLGYFQRKSKKIIWLGIDKGQQILRELFDVIEDNLEKLGFKREIRGLNPHITLAREVILKKDFNHVSKEVKIEKRIIPVNGISLMESTRVEGRLTYRPIYTKNFKASNRTI